MSFHRLSSHILIAVHDICDTEGLQVLITHCQSPALSAVFVISRWVGGSQTPPAIYACAHIISYESLPALPAGRASNSVQTFDHPKLLANGKRAHQRRAMVVKSHARDDSILLGYWTGRTPHRPGSLEVLRYDLDPELWGDSKEFAQSRFLKGIFTKSKVPNDLTFKIDGIRVDFNAGRVTLTESGSTEEACVKIATAFAVAILQVRRGENIYDFLRGEHRSIFLSLPRISVNDSPFLLGVAAAPSSRRKSPSSQQS